MNKIAPFIYDQNMKAPAIALLAILSATELGENIARWNKTEKQYEYYAKSSVYYNGREDGFVLQVSNSFCGSSVLHIYVSEHRNSDDIFVETWLDTHFGINPPAKDRPEEAYNARRFFKAWDYEGAYDFIVEKIAEHLKSCYEKADAVEKNRVKVS